MSNQKIRVLIVDDHAVVRHGLRLVLNMEPDIEVVGEAENGLKALPLAEELQPDLVLLDFVMPEMDGEATAAALQQKFPNIKILMLSGVELDDRILNMLSSGVDGCIIKDIQPDELARAIRVVAGGEAYLHPSLTRHVLKQMSAKTVPAKPVGPALTPRELEVLRLMATPATYREIAAQLFVSEETIRSHTKRILQKLNQPNRTQAVLAAVRSGLIS